MKLLARNIPWSPSSSSSSSSLSTMWSKDTSLQHSLRNRFSSYLQHNDWQACLRLLQSCVEMGKNYNDIPLLHVIIPLLVSHHQTRALHRMQNALLPSLNALKAAKPQETSNATKFPLPLTRPVVNKNSNDTSQHVKQLSSYQSNVSKGSTSKEVSAIDAVSPLSVLSQEHELAKHMLVFLEPRTDELTHSSVMSSSTPSTNSNTSAKKNTLKRTEESHLSFAHHGHEANTKRWRRSKVIKPERSLPLQSITEQSLSEQNKELAESPEQMTSSCELSHSTASPAVDGLEQLVNNWLESLIKSSNNNNTATVEECQEKEEKHKRNDDNNKKEIDEAETEQAQWEILHQLIFVAMQEQIQIPRRILEGCDALITSWLKQFEQECYNQQQEQCKKISKVNSAITEEEDGGITTNINYVNNNGVRNTNKVKRVTWLNAHVIDEMKVIRDVIHAQLELSEQWHENDKINKDNSDVLTNKEQNKSVIVHVDSMNQLENNQDNMSFISPSLLYALIDMIRVRQQLHENKLIKNEYEEKEELYNNHEEMELMYNCQLIMTLSLEEVDVHSKAVYERSNPDKWTRELPPNSVIYTLWSILRLEYLPNVKNKFNEIGFDEEKWNVIASLSNERSDIIELCCCYMWQTIANTVTASTQSNNCVDFKDNVTSLETRLECIYTYIRENLQIDEEEYELLEESKQERYMIRLIEVVVLCLLHLETLQKMLQIHELELSLTSTINNNRNNKTNDHDEESVVSMCALITWKKEMIISVLCKFISLYMSSHHTELAHSVLAAYLTVITKAEEQILTSSNNLLSQLTQSANWKAKTQLEAEQQQQSEKEEILRAVLYLHCIHVLTTDCVHSKDNVVNSIYNHNTSETMKMQKDDRVFKLECINLLIAHILQCSVSCTKDKMSCEELLDQIWQSLLGVSLLTYVNRETTCEENHINNGNYSKETDDIGRKYHNLFLQLMSCGNIDKNVKMFTDLLNAVSSSYAEHTNGAMSNLSSSATQNNNNKTQVLFWSTLLCNIAHLLPESVIVTQANNSINKTNADKDNNTSSNMSLQHNALAACFNNIIQTPEAGVLMVEHIMSKFMFYSVQHDNCFYTNVNGGGKNNKMKNNNYAKQEWLECKMNACLSTFRYFVRVISPPRLVIAIALQVIDQLCSTVSRILEQEKQWDENFLLKNNYNSNGEVCRKVAHVCAILIASLHSTKTQASSSSSSSSVSLLSNNTESLTLEEQTESMRRALEQLAKIYTILSNKGKNNEKCDNTQMEKTVQTCMRDSVLIFFYEAPHLFAKQHLAVVEKRNSENNNTNTTNVKSYFANWKSKQPSSLEWMMQYILSIQSSEKDLEQEELTKASTNIANRNDVSTVQKNFERIQILRVIEMLKLVKRNVPEQYHISIQEEIEELKQLPQILSSEKEMWFQYMDLESVIITLQKRKQRWTTREIITLFEHFNSSENTNCCAIVKPQWRQYGLTISELHLFIPFIKRIGEVLATRVIKQIQVNTKHLASAQTYEEEQHDVEKWKDCVQIVTAIIKGLHRNLHRERSKMVVVQQQQQQQVQKLEENARNSNYINSIQVQVAKLENIFYSAVQSLLNVDKVCVNVGMRWTLQNSNQSDSDTTNGDQNNYKNNNVYNSTHQLYSMISEFSALVAQAHKEIWLKTHGPNNKCSINIATEVELFMKKCQIHELSIIQHDIASLEQTVAVCALADDAQTVISAYQALKSKWQYVQLPSNNTIVELIELIASANKNADESNNLSRHSNNVISNANIRTIDSNNKENVKFMKEKDDDIHTQWHSASNKKNTSGNQTFRTSRTQNAEMQELENKTNIAGSKRKELLLLEELISNGVQNTVEYSEYYSVGDKQTTNSGENKGNMDNVNISAITQTSSESQQSFQTKTHRKYKHTSMHFTQYVRCVCDALFRTNLHSLCKDEIEMELHLYEVNCHYDVSARRLFASTPMLYHLANALHDLANNINESDKITNKITYLEEEVSTFITESSMNMIAVMYAMIKHLSHVLHECTKKEISVWCQEMLKIVEIIQHLSINTKGTMSFENITNNTECKQIDKNYIVKNECETTLHVKMIKTALYLFELCGSGDAEQTTVHTVKEQIDQKVKEISQYTKSDKFAISQTQYIGVKWLVHVTTSIFYENYEEPEEFCKLYMELINVFTVEYQPMWSATSKVRENVETTLIKESTTHSNNLYSTLSAFESLLELHQEYYLQIVRCTWHIHELMCVEESDSDRCEGDWHKTCTLLTQKHNEWQVEVETLLLFFVTWCDSWELQRELELIVTSSNSISIPSHINNNSALTFYKTLSRLLTVFTLFVKSFNVKVAIMTSLHEITLKAIKGFDKSKNDSLQNVKSALERLHRIQINYLKITGRGNSKENNNLYYNLQSDDVIALLMSASQNNSQATHTNTKGKLENHMNYNDFNTLSVDNYNLFLLHIVITSVMQEAVSNRKRFAFCVDGATESLWMEKMLALCELTPCTEINKNSNNTMYPISQVEPYMLLSQEDKQFVKQLCGSLRECMNSTAGYGSMKSSSFIKSIPLSFDLDRWMLDIAMYGWRFCQQEENHVWNNETENVDKNCFTPSTAKIDHKSQVEEENSKSSSSPSLLEEQNKCMETSTVVVPEVNEQYCFFITSLQELCLSTPRWSHVCMEYAVHMLFTFPVPFANLHHSSMSLTRIQVSWAERIYHFLMFYFSNGPQSESVNDISLLLISYLLASLNNISTDVNQQLETKEKQNSNLQIQCEYEEEHKSKEEAHEHKQWIEALYKWINDVQDIVQLCEYTHKELFATQHASSAELQSLYKFTLMQNSGKEAAMSYSTQKMTNMYEPHKYAYFHQARCKLLHDVAQTCLSQCCSKKSVKELQEVLSCRDVKYAKVIKEVCKVTDLGNVLECIASEWAVCNTENINVNNSSNSQLFNKTWHKVISPANLIFILDASQNANLQNNKILPNNNNNDANEKFVLPPLQLPKCSLFTLQMTQNEEHAKDEKEYSKELESKLDTSSVSVSNNRSVNVSNISHLIYNHLVSLYHAITNVHTLNVDSSRTTRINVAWHNLIKCLSQITQAECDKHQSQANENRQDVSQCSCNVWSEPVKHVIKMLYGEIALLIISKVSHSSQTHHVDTTITTNTHLVRNTKQATFWTASALLHFLRGLWRCSEIVESERYVSSQVKSECTIAKYIIQLLETWKKQQQEQEKRERKMYSNVMINTKSIKSYYSNHYNDVALEYFDSGEAQLSFPTNSSAMSPLSSFSLSSSPYSYTPSHQAITNTPETNTENMYICKEMITYLQERLTNGALPTHLTFQYLLELCLTEYFKQCVNSSMHSSAHRWLECGFDIFMLLSPYMVITSNNIETILMLAFSQWCDNGHIKSTTQIQSHTAAASPETVLANIKSHEMLQRILTIYQDVRLTPLSVALLIECLNQLYNELVGNAISQRGVDNILLSSYGKVTMMENLQKWSSQDRSTLFVLMLKRIVHELSRCTDMECAVIISICRDQGLQLPQQCKAANVMMMAREKFTKARQLKLLNTNNTDVKKNTTSNGGVYIVDSLYLLYISCVELLALGMCDVADNNNVSNIINNNDDLSSFNAETSRVMHIGNVIQSFFPEAHMLESDVEGHHHSFLWEVFVSIINSTNRCIVYDYDLYSTNIKNQRNVHPIHSDNTNNENTVNINRNGSNSIRFVQLLHLYCMYASSLTKVMEKLAAEETTHDADAKNNVQREQSEAKTEDEEFIANYVSTTKNVVPEIALSTSSEKINAYGGKKETVRQYHLQRLRIHNFFMHHSLECIHANSTFSPEVSNNASVQQLILSGPMSWSSSASIILNCIEKLLDTSEPLSVMEVNVITKSLSLLLQYTSFDMNAIQYTIMLRVSDALCKLIAKNMSNSCSSTSLQVVQPSLPSPSTIHVLTVTFYKLLNYLLCNCHTEFGSEKCELLCNVVHALRQVSVQEEHSNISNNSAVDNYNNNITLQNRYRNRCKIIRMLCIECIARHPHLSEMSAVRVLHDMIAIEAKLKEMFYHNNIQSANYNNSNVASYEQNVQSPEIVSEVNISNTNLTMYFVREVIQSFFRRRLYKEVLTFTCTAKNVMHLTTPVIHALIQQLKPVYTETCAILTPTALGDVFSLLHSTSTTTEEQLQEQKGICTTEIMKLNKIIAIQRQQRAMSEFELFKRAMNNNACKDAADMYVNNYLELFEESIMIDNENKNKENSSVHEVIASVVRLCSAMFGKGKYRTLLNFFTCLVSSISTNTNNYHNKNDESSEFDANENNNNNNKGQRNITSILSTLLPIELLELAVSTFTTVANANIWVDVNTQMPCAIMYTAALCEKWLTDMCMKTSSLPSTLSNINKLNTSVKTILNVTQEHAIAEKLFYSLLWISRDVNKDDILSLALVLERSSRTTLHNQHEYKQTEKEFWLQEGKSNEEQIEIKKLMYAIATTPLITSFWNNTTTTRNNSKDAYQSEMSILSPLSTAVQRVFSNYSVDIECMQSSLYSTQMSSNTTHVNYLTDCVFMLWLRLTSKHFSYAAIQLCNCVRQVKQHQNTMITEIENVKCIDDEEKGLQSGEVITRNINELSIFLVAYNRTLTQCAPSESETAHCESSHQHTEHASSDCIHENYNTNNTAKSRCNVTELIQWRDQHLFKSINAKTLERETVDQTIMESIAIVIAVSEVDQRTLSSFRITHIARLFELTSQLQGQNNLLFIALARWLLELKGNDATEGWLPFSMIDLVHIILMRLQSHSRTSFYKLSDLPKNEHAMQAEVNVKESDNKREYESKELESFSKEREEESNQNVMRAFLRNNLERNVVLVEILTWWMSSHNNIAHDDNEHKVTKRTIFTNSLYDKSTDVPYMLITLCTCAPSMQWPSNFSVPEYKETSNIHTYSAKSKEARFTSWKSFVMDVVCLLLKNNNNNAIHPSTKTSSSSPLFLMSSMNIIQQRKESEHEQKREEEMESESIVLCRIAHAIHTSLLEMYNSLESTFCEWERQLQTSKDAKQTNETELNTVYNLIVQTMKDVVEVMRTLAVLHLQSSKLNDSKSDNNNNKTTNCENTLDVWQAWLTHQKNNKTNRNRENEANKSMLKLLIQFAGLLPASFKPTTLLHSCLQTLQKMVLVQQEELEPYEQEEEELYEGEVWHELNSEKIENSNALNEERESKLGENTLTDKINLLDINAHIDWHDEEKALVKVLCIETCGTAWKDEYEKLTGSSSLICVISLMNNSVNSKANVMKWTNVHVNGKTSSAKNNEVEEQQRLTRILQLVTNYSLAWGNCVNKRKAHVRLLWSHYEIVLSLLVNDFVERQAKHNNAITTKENNNVVIVEKEEEKQKERDEFALWHAIESWLFAVWQDGWIPTTSSIEQIVYLLETLHRANSVKQSSVIHDNNGNIDKCEGKENEEKSYYTFSNIRYLVRLLHFAKMLTLFPPPLSHKRQCEEWKRQVEQPEYYKNNNNIMYNKGGEAKNSQYYERTNNINYYHEIQLRSLSMIYGKYALTPYVIDMIIHSYYVLHELYTQSLFYDNNNKMKCSNKEYNRILSQERMEEAKSCCLSFLEWAALSNTLPSLSTQTLDIIISLFCDCTSKLETSHDKPTKESTINVKVSDIRVLSSDAIGSTDKMALLQTKITEISKDVAVVVAFMYSYSTLTLSHIRPSSAMLLKLFATCGAINAITHNNSSSNTGDANKISTAGQIGKIKSRLCSLAKQEHNISPLLRARLALAYAEQFTLWSQFIKQETSTESIESVSFYENLLLLIETQYVQTLQSFLPSSSVLFHDAVINMVEKDVKNDNEIVDHNNKGINEVNTFIESLTNALGTLQALIHDAATSVDLQWVYRQLLTMLLNHMSSPSHYSLLLRWLTGYVYSVRNSLQQNSHNLEDTEEDEEIVYHFLNDCVEQSITNYVSYQDYSNGVQKGVMNMNSNVKAMELLSCAIDPTALVQITNVNHSTEDNTSKMFTVLDEQSVFYVPDKFAPHIVVDVFLLMQIKRVVLINKHISSSEHYTKEEDENVRNANIASVSLRSPSQWHVSDLLPKPESKQQGKDVSQENKNNHNTLLKLVDQLLQQNVIAHPVLTNQDNSNSCNTSTTQYTSITRLCLSKCLA